MSARRGGSTGAKRRTLRGVRPERPSVGASPPCLVPQLGETPPIRLGRPAYQGASRRLHGRRRRQLRTSLKAADSSSNVARGRSSTHARQRAYASGVAPSRPSPDRWMG